MFRSADPVLLTSLTDQALAAPWHRLRFAAPLESRYEADSAPAQIRHLTIVAIIGTLLVMLFVFSDQALIPDVIHQSILLRCIFCPTLAISAIIYLRQCKSAAIREALFASFGGIIPLSIDYLALITHSPHKATALCGVFLIPLYVNVVGQPRFTYALAASITAQIMLLFCLNVITGLAAPVRIVIAAVNFTTCVLTLVINFQLHKQARRYYLMTLREQLRNETLSKNNLELRTLSEEDPLTSVLNRRGIDARIGEIFRRCKRDDAPVGVVMIDVDHFKSYNDHFGHPAGDTCLQTIAAILIDQTRGRRDLVGRYGGEEFIIVMPDANLASVCALAERIRSSIEAFGIQAPPSLEAAGRPVMTASFGIAACSHNHARQPTACTCTPTDLIRAADQSLYTAKQLGRNRVHSA